jgi:hypothetical protein
VGASESLDDPGHVLWDVPFGAIHLNREGASQAAQVSWLRSSATILAKSGESASVHSHLSREGVRKLFFRLNILGILASGIDGSAT